MEETSSAGGGLSRFRSAPATWLEALLESEEAEDAIIDLPKRTPPPVHQHTSTSSATTSKPTFVVDPNHLIIPPTTTTTTNNNNNNNNNNNPLGSSRNSSPAEFFSQINNSDSALPNYLSSSGNVGLDNNNNQRVKFTTQLSGDQIALLDVEMDKVLGDSVLCRVRAKRGCATHPRSIAERVRRTRISDRIRKLQELVPNMDKQTNTADMLEEAVEYVKFLQRQIQELREHRDKCTCSVKN